MEDWKGKVVSWLTEDLLSARTIFAAMFYGAAVFLVVHAKEVPQVLSGIVNLLMGYYFGSKKNGGSNGA